MTANIFILDVLRYFQEWWWKKRRELQQPGTRLTIFWNGSCARGTRHIAWSSSPTSSESIGKGVDVELMVVPWYSQTPKDIAAMHATCKYGKQYEDLLRTADHLGQRWYAVVKFCDTRFAQSELKVYINFEKNYTTYRRAWGGPTIRKRRQKQQKQQ